MMFRIFADLNGVDRQGWIALTSNGSRRDLEKVGANVLKTGVRIVVYDYDREAEAVLEDRGGTWWARIDWRTFKKQPESD